MTKRQQKKPSLFLESSSDYRITDQDGQTVTLDNARKLWESGTLDDWNMAFARLARHNFDLEATKASYARLTPEGK